MFGPKRIAQNITYKIVGFGVPQISGAVVTIPLTIRISNESLVPIPVQSLLIELSFLQKNQYITAGNLVKEGFNIPPGEEDITVYPTLNLKAVFNNAWDTIVSSVKGQRFSIKADVSIGVMGVTSTDTIYKDFTL